MNEVPQRRLPRCTLTAKRLRAYALEYQAKAAAARMVRSGEQLTRLEEPVEKMVTEKDRSNMPARFDANHWHERTEGARAFADQMNDDASCRRLLRIAAD